MESSILCSQVPKVAEPKAEKGPEVLLFPIVLGSLFGPQKMANLWQVFVVTYLVGNKRVWTWFHGPLARKLLFGPVFLSGFTMTRTHGMGDETSATLLKHTFVFHKMVY